WNWPGASSHAANLPHPTRSTSMSRRTRTRTCEPTATGCRRFCRNATTPRHKPLPSNRPGSAGRRPRRRRARLERGDDIDDDRSVGGERLLQRRGKVAGLLDPDAAHAKTTRDLGEVGRSEPDQFFAAARPVTGKAMYAGQVLTEAGIV